MQEFISYTEARTLVLKYAPPPTSERAPLDEALGRTLAGAIESKEMIPPFDNSAMDGFAVRSADVSQKGVELPIVGTIAAGDAGGPPLPAGTCMRIMTGAPVPEGADAVVPIEQVEPAGERARFLASGVDVGMCIRRAGENVRVGERILDAGIRITPPVVGMLATLGYASVDVARRPIVSVVATGSELVDASESPGPGQIRDANGPMLAAQIVRAGAVVDGPHRVGDHRERLRRALGSAAAADVVVVSGGVSMGDFDFVRDELERVGFKPLFWKVRQRPGKPLLFGMIDQTPVFGLPGNPVSASVCFEQYVRPVLAAMLGRKDEDSSQEVAVLDEDISKAPGLYHFVRGHFVREQFEEKQFDRAQSVRGRPQHAAELRVAPTGPQGSHISQSLVLADCLIHLPDELEDPVRGTKVAIERLIW